VRELEAAAAATQRLEGAPEAELRSQAAAVRGEGRAVRHLEAGATCNACEGPHALSCPRACGAVLLGVYEAVPEQAFPRFMRVKDGRL